MARKSSVERANQMTGGFATARKNIIIQFGNKDRNTEDILKQIKEDVLSRGLSDSDFENVDIYVKPEEHKVFYVVNGNINGSIDV